MTGVDAGGSGNALMALRSAHKRRLLEQLATAPKGMTREELQAATGLSRSAIAEMLTSLGDAVEQHPDTTPGHGRPPLVHSIPAGAGVVVGIDVGRTRVYASVADLYGAPLDAAPADQEIPPEDRDDPNAVLTLAARLASDLLERHGRARDEIAAVGVCLPGPVDPATGRSRYRGAGAWSRHDVRATLRSQLGVDAPMAFDKDANAALLAERRWGAARGREDVLYVEWTSAIGASLMIGGEIWRGASDVAGELGHLRIPVEDEQERRDLQLDRQPIAKPCPHCEQLGCLDQLVGGLRLGGLYGIRTPEEAFERALRERQVRATGMAAARVIGRAIGMYVTLANPRRVLFNVGAVGRLRASYAKEMRAGFRQTAFRPALERDTLKRSALGKDASIRGAVAIALDLGVVSYLLYRGTADR